MATRRRFGWVRGLPSGRWQASYLAPDGQRRPAPSTFRSKAEGDRWLSLTDPDLRRELLSDFGDRWIAERSNLRPRTADLYRWLFGKHIAPHLGRLRLSDLDAGMVRTWRHDLLQSGVSSTMSAKAYRLLRAMLMTAVDNGILARNPCRMRGAGSEQSAEKPVLSVAQVFALSPISCRRASEPWCWSQRLGACGGARRPPCDGPTSTSLRASSACAPRWPSARRVSCLSVHPSPEPACGLSPFRVQCWPCCKPTSPTTPMTRPRSCSAATRAVPCAEATSTGVSAGPRAAAVSAVGAAGLHFHDLRHTGNTLAASSGASLRDLMLRMGHDSMRAALIYQHATANADQHIADALARHVGSASTAKAQSQPGDS